MYGYKLISFKLAGTLLMISMLLLLIFHLLIIFKVVPSDIVWGGQVKDPSSNLMTLEIIALLVTLFFIIMIAAKMDFIKVIKQKKMINAGIWVIFAYMILNTLGNLASAVSVENMIFAPITIVLALLAFRLAIEK